MPALTGIHTRTLADKHTLPSIKTKLRRDQSRQHEQS